MNISIKTFLRLAFYGFLLMSTLISNAQSSSHQQTVDSLLNIIATTNNDTTKAQIYSNLSMFLANSDRELALKYIDKSINIFEKIKYDKGISSCLNILFGIYSRTGVDSDTLLKYLKIHENFLNNSEDTSTIGMLYVNYANYYSKLGKTDQQIDYYLKALYSLRKQNNHKGENIVLYNIGVTFKEIGQLEKGIEYIEQALVNAKDYPTLEGKTSQQLSEIYLELNKLDRAKFYLDKAMKIYEQKNILVEIPYCKTLYGKLKAKHGEFQMAEKYFSEAISIALTLKGNKRVLRNTYSKVLSYFYEQRNYQKAISIGEKYMQLQMEINGSHVSKEVLDILHKSYSKLGQFEKAYEIQSQLIILSDSIKTSKHLDKISELETKFQVSEQKTKNQLLAAENTISKNRLRNIQLISIALFIALLLAGGLSYSIYKARQHAQQYTEELKSLDETKTRFFSNVSHEFKTPLTLIINPVSRLLQSNSLNEEEKFLAKSAEQNSLKLLELTNQVLELTKFEVNKVTINPIVFNLQQAVNKLFADFESLALSQKIQFIKQIKVNSQLNLELDYTKMMTILRNLISNAIKFTPENGQIFLRVLEKENTIEIHVEDSGRGIHESDLPHIFGRYYQAKIGNNIQDGGTGIGLAISAEYAKLLDGELNVQSVYGQGSNFVLTLPKTIAADDAISNQLIYKANIPTEKTKLSIPKNENNDAQTQLPCILIVEDNLDMQNYLYLILKDYYHLEIASHGKAALQILEQKHQSIQLIISDVMMPEMDGYELLEQLKKNKHYASIPTIMLTALSGTDDKLKALRIGIDDYLTKPFVDEELLVRIDNLIQNREERTAYINNTNTTTAKATATEESKTEQPLLNQIDLEWLEQLELYVNKNLRYTLTVDTIAEQLNVSRRTLYNKLKTLTGLTPNQYVNEIRFQAARKIIEENNNWTIKAIALKVGFKDEKNFSRNFKKRFGKNPSEYLA